MLALYRNIKFLRGIKGLSQQEVADYMGYESRAMISKIENGTIDLPLSKIHKFAELFGVSTSELMGNDDIAPDISEIIPIIIEINEEGKEMITQYAKYIASQPQYKKRNLAEMVEEEA